MAGNKVALTGIQPSGTAHIGNYLGMIRPALELARSYDAYYFLADEHALTTVRDPKALLDYTYEMAATLLSLGLDPKNVVMYRQSDVPAIFELALTPTRPPLTRTKRRDVRPTMGSLWAFTTTRF
jgi:tryptophanyl-tRNA synthetase